MAGDEGISCESDDIVGKNMMWGPIFLIMPSGGKIEHRGLMRSESVVEIESRAFARSCSSELSMFRQGPG